MGPLIVWVRGGIKAATAGFETDWRCLAASERITLATIWYGNRCKRVMPHFPLLKEAQFVADARGVGAFRP